MWSVGPTTSLEGQLLLELVGWYVCCLVHRDSQGSLEHLWLFRLSHFALDDCKKNETRQHRFYAEEERGDKKTGTEL